jgi:hypothetical protein
MSLRSGNYFTKCDGMKREDWQSIASFPKEPLTGSRGLYLDCSMAR